MLHVLANFRKEYMYLLSSKCKVNTILLSFFDDKEGEICPAFPAGCRKGRVRINKDGCPVCDSKGIFSEQYVYDLFQYQIISRSVYIFLNL